MRSFTVIAQVLFLGVAVCFALPGFRASSGTSASLVNRIDGIVWSPARRPVPDVYVELQNEMYQSLSRIRTTSSGRFSFTVANPGNYYVKVLASGTNYLDATELVEIVNVAQRSSDNAYLDIVLKVDKRKASTGLSGVTDSVFVQEVPDAAKKLYRSALNTFDDDAQKAFEKLDQALQIFPDYFDALNTAGREYVARKEYQKSLPYLVHSIDVNQRSYSSFYALAYACYQLKQLREGLEAARGATMIQPNAADAQLLYGTLLRLDGNYEKAEKALLAAIEASKETPIPEIRWQLALVYNRMGRNKEAADQLDKYLAMRPEAADKSEIKELIGKLRK